MNSLNILSGLTTTPPPSPPRSRSASQAELDPSKQNAEEYGVDTGELSEKLGDDDMTGMQDEGDAQMDEKSPLLGEGSNDAFQQSSRSSRVWGIPRRVAEALSHGLAVVFTAIAAPGRYVVASFYDEEGHFSAILPLRAVKNLLLRRRRRPITQAGGMEGLSEKEELERETGARRKPKRRSPSVDSVASSTSIETSDGEVGNEREDSPARHTRSRTAAAQERDEINPQKKSIRIKLGSSDEALRKRKAQKSADKKRSSNAHPDDVAAVATALKSPSSPSTNSSSKLTRYPRLPAAPRPLVPRRQPSYALPTYVSPETYLPAKKTLIIDLDETLIHSMAKGGRMSTGHMVEVRLTTSYPSALSGVPILYYVHERPGCHDFLRKVCKWYNLVVFTASVQEYADPVIDWLERERKYFSGRYYRQHCTFRNGAYIKDLAQVEPDLSRVMILDNSPMSYIFHEDNAIPIEGWISDPTDMDLLHLVPFLEGLQYATDVRALLALRQGQAQQA
ncbi:hypothetical protein MBLNU230_g1473t1 [Neophaeotheca triangularis]